MEEGDIKREEINRALKKLYLKLYEGWEGGGRKWSTCGDMEVWERGNEEMGMEVICKNMERGRMN